MQVGIFKFDFTWKMSDCVVRLRLGLIAHIVPFYPLFFPLSLSILSILKVFVIVFSGTVEAKILKVGGLIAFIFSLFLFIHFSVF